MRVRLPGTECADFGDVHEVNVVHEDPEVIQGDCTDCGLYVDANKTE